MRGSSALTLFLSLLSCSRGAVSTIAPRHGDSSEILWSGTFQGPDGREVRAFKRLDSAGQIQAVYRLANGQELSREAFLAAMQSYPARKLAKELEDKLERVASDTSVDVLLTLRTPSLHSIARAIGERNQRDVLALAHGFAIAKANQRASWNTRYDALTLAMRREVAAAMTAATRTARAGLRAWLDQHGGELGPPLRGFPLCTARVPAMNLRALATRPELRFVESSGVADAQLDVSVSSTRADAFWNHGYRGGASAFDPGILDSGVDLSHPGLRGLRASYHVSHHWASRSSNYRDSFRTGDDFHGHGTAVAGILASRGTRSWSRHLGMAPGLKNRLYNLKSAYRTTSGAASLFFADAIANIDWGIFGSKVDDIDLLNFSYGNTASSDDSALARFLDAMVDDLAIPVIVAAGNRGPRRRTLINPAGAYNVLTVASMNDINTKSRRDDVISLSSSRGPTIGGRRKPDITAPGAFIQTTNSRWETQADYTTWSGTSFAAPHVTGAVLLAMDAFGPPVQPMRIKALLLDSADKWGGLGFHTAYGWGYLDLQDAWDRRKATYQKSVAPRGQRGDFDLYLATFDAPHDTATLVWNRHVSYQRGGKYPGQWYGLNDLDLILYEHSTGRVIDRSASGIDNVEQVMSSAPKKRECVIRVAATDKTFRGVAKETYALAGPPGTTFPARLPTLELTASFPRTVLAGDFYDVLVHCQNSGDLHAIHPSLTLTIPSGHRLIEGSRVTRLKTLLRRRSNQETQRLRLQAPRTPGKATLRLDLTSRSWGEVFRRSMRLTIETRPVPTYGTK